MKGMIVQWYDAITIGDSRWQAKEEVDDFLDELPPLMYTIGFLLYECDTHICLTDSIGPNEYGHMTKIPKGMIVKVYSFEPQETS